MAENNYSYNKILQTKQVSFQQSNRSLFVQCRLATLDRTQHSTYSVVYMFWIIWARDDWAHSIKKKMKNKQTNQLQNMVCDLDCTW